MSETRLAAAHQRMLDGMREALKRKTPEGRIEALDPAQIGVHPSRDADYAAIYDSYCEQIVAAVGDPIGFGHIFGKLEQELRFGGLNSVKSEPLQQDLWKSQLEQFGYQICVRPSFQHCWRSGEVAGLANRAR